MNIDLNYEQSALIELLSMYTGKPSSQMLLEAALMLLDRDAGTCEHCHATDGQYLVAAEKIEARLAQLLVAEGKTCVACTREQVATKCGDSGFAGMTNQNYIG